MPKRSLGSGNGDPKKIEQLNKALDGMLANTNSKIGNIEAAECEF